MMLAVPAGENARRHQRRSIRCVRMMLAGVLFVAVGAFAHTASPAHASGVRDARSIQLVDQSGAPFHLADLRGRRTLLTFVATRCTDVCPIANVTFRRLAQRLRHAGIDARLLTVTLDPDYDTPFVMAHMARSFSAEPHEWTFASGRPSDVHRLMRVFGVVAEQPGTGVPEVHSAFVYVLDGHVRLARTLLLSTGLSDAAEQALKDAMPVSAAAERRLPRGTRE